MQVVFRDQFCPDFVSLNSLAHEMLSKRMPLKPWPILGQSQQSISFSLLSFIAESQDHLPT